MAIIILSMATIYSHIAQAAQCGQKLLFVLIDPDKEVDSMKIIPYLSEVDVILVGGSTGERTEDCVAMLKSHVLCPIVLFPGNVAQFTPSADAILFLTLLTARSAEVLIEPHIHIAPAIHQSNLESIPMGYILIDGGKQSSVERVSKSVPISATDVSMVVRTAIAGELLGEKLLYLEAGSGALYPIAAPLITAVKENTSIPLIVGGGITTPKGMLDAFRAGADVVVIGNHFEKYPEEIPHFIEQKRKIYG